MEQIIDYDIRGVTKKFYMKKKPIQALEEINLSIRKNEFIAILGTSGCGKSTLLRMIAGFISPTTGSIVTGDGKVINGPGPDRGMVFQSYTLFPWMTVMQNIEYGLKETKIPLEKRNEVTQQYIAAMGLEGFENVYPNSLSGGMKQRVAIARSMANNPESLLLDEPFSALDAQTRVGMQELMLKVWAEFPKTIVMVTHDIEEAIFMADRVVVMRARPGSIKDIADINLPRPRDFHMKSSPEFVAYKRWASELIYEESMKIEEEICD